MAGHSAIPPDRSIRPCSGHLLASNQSLHTPPATSTVPGGSCHGSTSPPIASATPSVTAGYSPYTASITHGAVADLVSANPRYTPAYTSQPLMITGVRPTRSDSLPSGRAASAYRALYSANASTT